MRRRLEIDLRERTGEAIGAPPFFDEFGIAPGLPNLGDGRIEDAGEDKVAFLRGGLVRIRAFQCCSTFHRSSPLLGLLACGLVSLQFLQHRIEPLEVASQIFR
jgi:hypothetical protein